MKAVLQRVKHASVNINNEEFSSINKGILLFLCVEKGDKEEYLNWLVKKIISLRIFEDDNGKMNKSVVDVNGQVLVVSQFTLAADCKKGTRPSFDNAENPNIAEQAYNKFVELLSNEQIAVKTGVFGANMQVAIVNDGPVTFVLNKYSE